MFESNIEIVVFLLCMQRHKQYVDKMIQIHYDTYIHTKRKE